MAPGPGAPRARGSDVAPSLVPRLTSSRGFRSRLSRRPGLIPPGASILFYCTPYLIRSPIAVVALVLFSLALLLRHLYAGVSFCIVAGHGNNRARTHPLCRRDLGGKSEVDRCRIISPTSTKTPPFPGDPPTPGKNNSGNDVPRAAFVCRVATPSRPTFRSGRGFRRTATRRSSPTLPGKHGRGARKATVKVHNRLS